MPPTNSYPAALNSWLNPSSGTLRDAPGYELASVITQLQQHAAGLEAKVGYGASTPAGSAAVLRRTASGQSAWSQIQSADIADGTILGSDIAPTTIVGANLVNATLGTTQLGDGCVTTAKILDQTILIGDIAVRATMAISTIGVTNPSSSSTSMVKITGSDLSVTATGKQGLLCVTLIGWGATVAATGNVNVYDGGSVLSGALNASLSGSWFDTGTAIVPNTLSSGVHPLSLYWSTTAGTQSANSAYLTYLEFKNNS
jgi:hypothetical protein